jgi:hypothetical protein
VALENEYEGWTEKIIPELEAAATHPFDLTTVNIEPDPYYEKLSALISTSGKVERVVVIQHANSTSKVLISRLLHADSTVELFLQDPEWSTPRDSPLGLPTGVEDLRNRYREDGGELIVRYYRTPASLRVVWAVERVLAVSWYTYHQTAAALTRESGYNLLGHSRPNLVALNGTEAYRMLSEMVESVLSTMREFAGSPVVHLKRGRVAKPLRGRERQGRETP